MTISPFLTFSLREDSEGLGRRPIPSFGVRYLDRNSASVYENSRRSSMNFLINLEL